MQIDSYIMAKISLNNIAEELAARNNLAREVADNFMRAFVETIEKGLQEDGIVKIKGLGTFKLQEMSDRGSVDVNTGERITIKGYRKVTFAPDSAMKEFVNRPFAHFEPTELNEGYPTEEEPSISETTDENNDTEIVEEVVKVVEEETSKETTEEVTEVPVVADSAIEEEVPISSELQSGDLETPEATIEEVVEHVVDAAPEVVEQAVSEVEEAEQTEDVMDEVSDATVGETEEVVEETVGATTDETEDSTDTTAREVAIEEEVTTEEASDVTAEETQESQDIDNELEVMPQEEVIVAEDEVAVSEAPVELPEEPAEQPVPVVEQSAEIIPQPKEEPKKRRGCGWILVLLLIATAVGVYYWYAADFAAEEQAYTDDIDEYDDMMVNPNLEEELGVEWGDEPKIKTHLPADKKEVSATSEVPAEIPADKSGDDVVQEEAAPAAPEAAKPQSLETAKPATDEKFCAVTITESLQAKTIKDITPADTTDYAIDGTLVTHELKNGETIIQLARKYYGDKRLWPYIVKYNWMKDFNHVAIGQMINIPILKEKQGE